MHGFRPAVPARAATGLGPDRVHVWRLPYRVDMRRRPFRDLVAAYLGTTGERVAFRDAPGGRPAICAPHTDLSVNWSHSGGHAVVAVARSLPRLGVDFEIARPRPRARALTRRFFHADECIDLSSREGIALETDFLRLWTAKEAVLKALGEGLRFGLDRVVFHLQGDEIVPVRFAEAAGAAGDWCLHRLDDATGYASVAWFGPQRRVEWLACDDPGAELSAHRPVP